MAGANNFEWLTKAISQATRSATFCVSGCLDPVDPGLVVDGLGEVKFPMKGKVAKELLARCAAAPYGKGTRTLVDKKVRNTYELDPGQFQLQDAWTTAMAEATRTAAASLGLPDDRLEARLYKLLVYDKGGFFLPHRDSEKHDRMVASLIVVLPNAFEGGALVVRHGAASRKLTFNEAAWGQAPCYAAFYADCEHEVQRVVRGVRLCLAYNLVLKPQRKQAKTVSPSADPVDIVAESIRAWFARQADKPLVFALDHHYTQRGLSLDLLKGADRKLADVVVAAAQHTGGRVHLAQVTRHLSQFADDGSFARSYSRWAEPKRGKIEIGETYDDELELSEWASLEGKKQPWGNIALETSSIVSAIPLDDWKPTSEEFEGYTGNAGNTLDRWYHRSALVVWPGAQHYVMVAKSGVAVSIPLLGAMVDKLAKTAEKRLEDARAKCLQFARAIIAQWRHRSTHAGMYVSSENSHYQDFPRLLLALNDQDVVRLFLSTLAERDQATPLEQLVVHACRDFGWTEFAPELKLLLTATPEPQGRTDIPIRDLEWLSAYCCDKRDAPGKSALAVELCGLATERYCTPHPPEQSRYHRHDDDDDEPSMSEKSLVHLLKALAACHRHEELARVIRFVEEAPEHYRLEYCQVPTLQSIIPWSQKQLGQIPPPLAAWLADVRHQLETATARPPAPPQDWSRPAEITCRCQFCSQVQAFLADPLTEVKRIPAREDLRSHMSREIWHHQCDLHETLDRKGSPHALVLTKTLGSHDRAVKRYEINCRLRDSLPASQP